MADSLVPLITAQELATTVQRLAQEIDRDYGDRSPIIIGILKGSFIFLADLVRQIQTPIQRIELIKLSSYGSGTVSSGDVKMQIDIPVELIANQDVIIVEDIVDTGLSLSTALEVFKTYNPASLKLCALLDKPDRRKVAIPLDYCGITIPDKFIVGYGIDYAEKYRQLNAIYVVEDC